MFKFLVFTAATIFFMPPLFSSSSVDAEIEKAYRQASVHQEAKAVDELKRLSLLQSIATQNAKAAHTSFMTQLLMEGKIDKKLPGGKIEIKHNWGIRKSGPTKSEFEDIINAMAIGYHGYEDSILDTVSISQDPSSLRDLNQHQAGVLYLALAIDVMRLNPVKDIDQLTEEILGPIHESKRSEVEKRLDVTFNKEQLRRHLTRHGIDFVALVKAKFDELDLRQHLRDPGFYYPILELVDKGREFYATPGLSESMRSAGYTGGGREGYWIEDMFGRVERKIIDELKELTPPPTWTLQSVNDAYEKIQGRRSSVVSTPTFTVVKGMGANYLHDYPLGQNCILQLASQFNFLESPGPFIIDVSDYVNDRTRGPQASVEAAAASLQRTAAVTSGKLPHALTNILPEEATYYGAGYLQLMSLDEAKLEDLYHVIEKKIPQLIVLPQWVQCEESGAIQLQVFCAAPSYQGCFYAPTFDSWGGKICNLLVSAQYEAIAKLAVIQSVMRSQTVPLHLTLVGQGAFNNPPEVMKSAFEAVAQAVKGYNVHVYIHAFSPGDVAKVMDSLSANYIFNNIDKEEFKKRPHPTNVS